MFKLGSFENELMSSMAVNLAKDAEEQYQINKVAKAIDYLNAAADIFDKSGMYKEADEITRIMGSIAGDQLVSEADFDMSKLISSLKDLGGFDKKDLLNIFTSVVPGAYFAKTVYFLYDKYGDKGGLGELKKDVEKLMTPEGGEQVWEELKDGFMSRLSTVLKSVNILKLL